MTLLTFSSKFCLWSEIWFSHHTKQEFSRKSKGSKGSMQPTSAGIESIHMQFKCTRKSFESPSNAKQSSSPVIQRPFKSPPNAIWMLFKGPCHRILSIKCRISTTGNRISTVSDIDHRISNVESRLPDLDFQQFRIPIVYQFAVCEVLFLRVNICSL